METVKNKILVPWDFTEKAEYAFQHAVRIAKLAQNEIVLLNIVKKQKEEEEVGHQLEEIAVKLGDLYGIKPITIAKEGSIFTTINEVSKEIGANLVVMGTHGIKGMQKLTGSWALKVISDSVVPFIVVQKAPERDYQNILFPVDFKVESKQKITWANYLSKYYKLKITLLGAKVSKLLEKNVKANLVFTKKYLANHEIDFDIVMSEGKGNVVDETIEISKEHEVDMILIMTTKDIGITDYMFGADEQKIIANEAGIPVMCVNPSKVMKLSSFS